MKPETMLYTGYGLIGTATFGLIISLLGLIYRSSNLAFTTIFALYGVGAILMVWGMRRGLKVEEK